MESQHDMIIALFGPCCCGKSTIAKGFGGLGVDIMEVSEVVRLPSGRTAAETPWEELLREIPVTFVNHGRTFFAAQLLHHLRTVATNRVVVVSGLRIIEELEALQDLYRVRPLGVFASYNTRVNRLRRRAGGPKDPARYVFERDTAEALWGLPALFESVGYDRTIFTDELTQDEVLDAARSLVL